MKIICNKMYEVPISLRLTVRNVLMSKQLLLEREIEAIYDDNQKVNEWNVMMDEFRMMVDVVEQFGLLPEYQIARFRNRADKLERKGDGAMTEVHGWDN